MPPLPSPGKVIKIQISGTLQGGEFTNIFHVSYTGVAPTVATLEDLDTAVLDTYANMYQISSVGELNLLNVKYTDLSIDTGNVYEASHAITCTLTGDVVSANNAVCVSWPILRRYRGGHPRSYFMWGSSSTLEGSSTINWQASFIANAQTACIEWMEIFQSNPVSALGATNLVNVSYYSGGAIRVTPAVDLITTAIAKTRVCSQRRRLGKVGG